MESRRLVAGVIGVVLALVGTVVIVLFVNRAEDRALANEKLVQVYVVNDRVAAGTSGAEVESAVRLERVPAKVRAAGAVSDLGRLKKRVAQVDLVPGEQLVLDRFVSPDAFDPTPSRIALPDGLVEITVALDPERALGGRVRPADKVGALLSFEPFELSAVNLAAGTVNVNGQDVPIPQDLAQTGNLQTPNTTHLTLHKILVTEVQTAPDSVDLDRSVEDAKQDEAKTGLAVDAPSGQLYVTLALSAADAERLVFAAEFGTIWLANEPDSANEADTRVVTRDNVYREPVIAR